MLLFGSLFSRSLPSSLRILFDSELDNLLHASFELADLPVISRPPDFIVNVMLSLTREGFVSHSIRLCTVRFYPISNDWSR